MVPKSVFHFLAFKSTAKIQDLVARNNEEFDILKHQDSETKENHLRLFRPNLENPANAEMTRDLNKAESERTE